MHALGINASRDTRASTVLLEERDRIGAAEPNISLDPIVTRPKVEGDLEY